MLILSSTIGPQIKAFFLCGKMWATDVSPWSSNCQTSSVEPTPTKFPNFGRPVQLLAVWTATLGSVDVWNTANMYFLKSFSSQRVQNGSRFGKTWKGDEVSDDPLLQELILCAFGINIWALRTCQVHKSKGWRELFLTRFGRSAWANTWHASRLELM